MDKDKDGMLNLDQLILFLAEAKKTGLIQVRQTRSPNR
jgi:hypothetical protein